MTTKMLPTVAEYARIFVAEKSVTYSVVDAFEARMGFAVDEDRLLAAARVLACPLKENPPNWQHGRVLYALALNYLQTLTVPQPITMLDVGTAKGFSALMALWALNESPHQGKVFSVDVIDPFGTMRRNSVLECDGPKTLAQFLADWPESHDIAFEASTGVNWLKRHPGRVHVAFVDGKHKGSVVAEEAALLAQRQSKGDVVLFDDAHMPDVGVAVADASQHYALEWLTIKPGRAYVIGRRR